MINLQWLFHPQQTKKKLRLENVTTRDATDYQLIFWTEIKVSSHQREVIQVEWLQSIFRTNLGHKNKHQILLVILSPLLDWVLLYHLHKRSDNWFQVSIVEKLQRLGRCSKWERHPCTWLCIQTISVQQDVDKQVASLDRVEFSNHLKRIVLLITN